MTRKDFLLATTAIARCPTPTPTPTPTDGAAMFLSGCADTKVSGGTIIGAETAIHIENCANIELGEVVGHDCGSLVVVKNSTNVIMKPE